MAFVFTSTPTHPLLFFVTSLVSVLLFVCCFTLISWSKGESKHGANGESLGSSKHGGRLGQSSRHAEAKSSGSAASKREVSSACMFYAVR